MDQTTKSGMRYIRNQTRYLTHLLGVEFMVICPESLRIGRV